MPTTRCWTLPTRANGHSQWIRRLVLRRVLRPWRKRPGPHQPGRSPHLASPTQPRSTHTTSPPPAPPVAVPDFRQTPQTLAKVAYSALRASTARLSTFSHLSLPAPSGRTETWQIHHPSRSR